MARTRWIGQAAIVVSVLGLAAVPLVTAEDRRTGGADQDYGSAFGTTRIEIDGVNLPATTRVAEPITESFEVVEYQDGTDTAERYRPGRRVLSNVVLRGPLPVPDDLRAWVEAIAEGHNDRKSLVLEVVKPDDEVVERYAFSGAWPASLTSDVTGPSFAWTVVLRVESMEVERVGEGPTIRDGRLGKPPLDRGAGGRVVTDRVTPDRRVPDRTPPDRRVPQPDAGDASGTYTVVMTNGRTITASVVEEREGGYQITEAESGRSYFLPSDAVESVSGGG